MLHKLFLVILFLFVTNNIFCQKEIEMIEIPFYLKSSGKTVLIHSTGSTLTFFAKGKIIGEEEFFYYPFHLKYPKECNDYFEKLNADSVEMTFHVEGILGNSYDYKVGLSKEFNFINEHQDNFYELNLEDLVPIGRRNKLIIEKIGVPYIFSFYKKRYSNYQKSYFNWKEFKSIKLFRYSKRSKRMTEEEILKYSNYRSSFWKKK